MYVLDSNVISELRQGKAQPSPAVRAWAAQRPAHQLYLSAITVMELEMGARLLERKDPIQGATLRAWVRQVAREFEGRILPFSGTTALVCAPMHVPDKKSFRDSMIAASALEHGFAVVTRNVSDFELPGLTVVNPWDAL
jgi:predicted nucleic acid-binding protein